MSAGNKWKIRPEEKWEDDIAPGAVEGEFEDAGDGNFKRFQKPVTIPSSGTSIK